MNADLPNWARSINQVAHALGGAGSLVDLRAESLLTAAGLSEVPAHLEQLTTSLQTEASLHAVGAIMARAELVRALRFRKRLREIGVGQAIPAIDGTGTTVFIIGFARSATSFLLRSLAADARFVAPRTFELLMPDALDATNVDAMIASATEQDELWSLLDPSFPSIHLNRGDLVAECLPVQAASMLSHHWTGCYLVPSYDQILDQDESLEAFRFHRVFRDHLAASHPAAIPLFKSPAYARQLDRLIPHYPDGRFIVCIRNLDDAVTSLARMFNSIRAMRSSSSSIRDTANRDALSYFRKASKRLRTMTEAGFIGATNCRAVLYDDLLSRPAHLLTSLAEWLTGSGSHAQGRGAFTPWSEQYTRRKDRKPDPGPRIEIPTDLREEFDRLVVMFEDRGVLLR